MAYIFPFKWHENCLLETSKKYGKLAKMWEIVLHQLVLHIKQSLDKSVAPASFILQKLCPSSRAKMPVSSR